MGRYKERTQEIIRGRQFASCYIEAPPNKSFERTARQLVSHQCCVVSWEGLAAKILQSVRNFKGFSPEQMKAIKAEVFISAGDHNEVSLEDIVEMHKLIPKSQLAVFPNTEHVVLMTNPDKVLVKSWSVRAADAER